MPSQLTPIHVHADVLHFKFVIKSPIIYYGMHKNIVKNKLSLSAIMPRHLNGILMPSKMTPTCSYRCFAL